MIRVIEGKSKGKSKSKNIDSSVKYIGACKKKRVNPYRTIGIISSEPWFYEFSDCKTDGAKWSTSFNKYKRSMNFNDVCKKIKSIDDEIKLIEGDLNEFANTMTLNIGYKTQKNQQKQTKDKDVIKNKSLFCSLI